MVQDVTDIEINPDRNNWLAGTLYMYLSDDDKMDLKPEIYPGDADNKKLKYNSSDDSIASVDENGVVTAYKDGKVKITIEAESGDVKLEFNILIFDKSVTTKFGDVDGDGETGPLDLAKLRKYLAS